MAEPAADSPQLFISYHLDDLGFANRLISELGPLVDGYGIWLDDVSVNPGQVAATTRAVLQHAKAVVLVISKRYLDYGWAPSARGAELLKTLPGDPLRVFVLVLDVATSEALPFLHFEYRLLNPNDLAFREANAEVQNDILARAVHILRAFFEADSGSTVGTTENTTRQLTLANLSKFEQSAEVKNALRRACRLAVGAPRLPPIVTPTALLFGLAEGGWVEVDYVRTPQFLWKELTARGKDAYRGALMQEFPGLAPFGEDAGRTIDSIAVNVDLLTPDVLRVFEEAATIARETTPLSRAKLWEAGGNDQFQQEIGARHLLGALLLLDPDGNTSRALSTIVDDVAAFREHFYDFIVKNVPDDYHNVWRSKLTKLTAERTPQPAARQKESMSQPTVAGFMADEWTGRDLLGITQDVNALASLVAAYKVEPPLSIGLFGDWGSGKSHFMRQMRKRVELLSQKARQSGKPQNELGYYKNIVQIEFNAWHYIEGNLWASLVDHIFANLKLSEKEPRKYAEQRRDELLQKLGLKEELKQKIDSQVEECEAELRKVVERRQQAEVELSNASTQLANFRRKAEASLETLTVAVDLSTEQKELLSRLGVDTDGVVNGAALRKKYDELKGLRNRIKAQWQLFRSGRGAVSRYVLSAVLVTIVFGGPLLLKLGTFPRVPTVILTVLGSIATFVAAIKPVRDQFNKTLTALEQHDRDIERERLKRITELESEVNALGSEVVAAKLKSETVGKEIDQLKADIASTSSTRLLAEFIEDRAAASDYRRHLGLLALIRRDFEKLRDLFEQQRQEEAEGKELGDDKKINRIVLYIDDLDRCPPNRVVQVLQAIHLLLAFPLFVVVVGVDSRWITRSLEQSYEWLRDADEEPPNGEQKNGTEEQDGHRGLKAAATPHDYLEKIFQIPFWLRSMDQDACVEFLNGLTTDATENPPPPVVNEKEQAEKQQQSPATPGRHAAAKTMVLPPPSPSYETGKNPELDNLVAEVITRPFFAPAPGQSIPALDLAPRSLTFSTYEIDYMKKLVPLIGRSPRAVKRFLNCYRLIKVSLTPAEFESFVGENGDSQVYKAAMILLGVITGTPAVSTYVIDHLKFWRPQGVETTVETWANLFARDPEVQRQPDSAQLIQFFETYDFNPRSSSERLILEMVNWAPKVSRFSFRLNRPEPSRR